MADDIIDEKNPAQPHIANGGAGPRVIGQALLLRHGQRSPGLQHVRHGKTIQDYQGRVVIGK